MSTRIHSTSLFVTTALATLAAATAQAQLTISPGLSFGQEGGTIGAGNLGTGGTPFAKDLLGGGSFAPTHTIPNVNNGTYGNPSSWIGDSANSYVGVGLASPQTFAGLAFGRDNTGTFADRAAGLYTVQYTMDANPAANHASATWTTAGTINLGGNGGLITNVGLRHRFELDSPVVGVTGVRLITPGNGIGSGAAIDELEIFSTSGPSIGSLVTTAQPGFSVAWTGTDGANFNTSATPTVPNNIALASNGTSAIASSELGPQLGIGYHLTLNLNDGLYGNLNSWIGGDGAAGPAYAGVMFNGLYNVSSLAWGRDNGNNATDCCGGQAGDRSLGLYGLQYTTDGSLWNDIGSVSLNYGQDDALGGGLTPYFRHEFNISQGGNPVQAMGIRLLVPGTGLGGGTAIDELEVYGVPVPEPTSAVLISLGLGGLMRRRRN